MGPSDHPETPVTPTGIQAAPETLASAPVPLPPPPSPAISVERFTHMLGRLDIILVALVLFFAFLVASTPVINADFFRQLAVGRLVLHGEYHFGTDPFSYAGDGVYSVNHSWLFALMVYGLYHLPVIGGAAVVVAKALLVTALAAILLRVGRRPGQNLWIPAACTALAILALSPRLYLQSTCLSFLFLGLTLWLLTAVGTSGKRIWWWLPPLFLLWVNCDQWFFLGPLTAALYLVGDLLELWLSPPEGEAGPRRRELLTLGLVLLASLVACLVNPHHVRAFTLPVELGLSPGHDALEGDLQFRNYFLSPVRKSYYEPYVGLSVAGLALAPLLLVGLASFVAMYGRAPGWRLPIWLVFALLALYNSRTVPFFAVVGGPIAALNWLDYAAGRNLLTTPGGRAWSLGGRALSILLVLGLLVATVPGWIHAQPYEGHRIGWRVKVDPSLQQAAEQIKRWRDKGELPAETHWFNTQQEVAHYLAWFAPGERVFLDPSLPFYPDAADDYRNLRDGLVSEARAEQEPEGEPAAKTKDWRKALHKRKVQFWIFDQAALQTSDLIAGQMLFRPSEAQNEWRMCYLHGRIGVFAWRDPKAEETPNPSPPEVDLKRLAFGPEAEQAPPSGPEGPPRSNDWWEAWWRAKPPVPLDRESAALYGVRYQAAKADRIHDNSRAWQAAVATNAFTASLSHGPVPNSLLALSWGCTYEALFPQGARRPVRRDLPREGAALMARALYVRSQDAGPPEALYLAVRAARRALRDDAEDPQAHLLLAQAYTRLEGETQEQYLKTVLPQLADIRRAQKTTAFQNALRFGLTPRDAATAHEALFSVFRQLKYPDAAANHLREGIKSLRAAGPLPGEPPENFQRRLEDLSNRLNALEDEAQRQERSYTVNSANRPPLEKVRMALERGLAESALNAMKEASSKDISTVMDRAIVARVGELLLDLGRVDEAADLLVPEGEEADKPVPPSTLNARLRLAAARGNYAEADRHLADALNHAWKEPLGNRERAPDPLAEFAKGVGRVLLLEAQRLGGVPRPPDGFGAPRLPVVFPLTPSRSFAGGAEFGVRHLRLQALLSGLLVQQERGELHLTRGWLALESGRCDEARRDFEAASEALPDEKRWVPEVNRLNSILDVRELQLLQQLPARQAIARAWARHYLEWLK